MTYSMSSNTTTPSPGPRSGVPPSARPPSQASLSSLPLGRPQPQQDSTSEETTPLEKKDSPGRAKLRSWLHALMSVVLSDGRTLVGTFVCTDRDTNIILSSCTEHLPHTHTDGEEEARMLGLAMVPGRHVVSLSVDERTINQRHHQLQQQQQLQQLQLHEKLEETSSVDDSAGDPTPSPVTPGFPFSKPFFPTPFFPTTASTSDASGQSQAGALDPPAGYT